MNKTKHKTCETCGKLIAGEKCNTCDDDNISMEKLTLSDVQLKHLNNCPACGSTMHEVPSIENTELYLWCDNCTVSMDSDGGYTI